MVPVEGSGGDVVESVVVDPCQPVGPIRIGPDPALERGLDPGEFFFRGLGVDDIQNPALAVPFPDRVEDLRHPAVERIGNELAGMPAFGAPFGSALSPECEHSGVDRPGGQFS